MPRPTTKAALLAAMQTEHDALEQQLAALTSEQLAQSSATIEAWCVKDILTHVTAWEQLCLGWYQAGMEDEVPPMPAAGFKWNQIPALNQQIYAERRTHAYADIRRDFDRSYQQIRRTVDAIPEEEMFTPERYRWTRKNAMGTYFVSATSSHYSWARKEIKKLSARSADFNRRAMPTAISRMFI